MIIMIMIRDNDNTNNTGCRVTVSCDGPRPAEDRQATPSESLSESLIKGNSL